MPIWRSQTRAFFDQREKIRFGIDSTVHSSNFLRLLTTRDRDCLTWLAHYLLSINHKDKALVPYWLARNARTDWNDSLIGLLAFPHRPNCFPWTATVLLRFQRNALTILLLRIENLPSQQAIGLDKTDLYHIKFPHPIRKQTGDRQESH